MRSDISALKQWLVVTCECQESWIVVSCQKFDRAMHLVPDYVYGLKVPEKVTDDCQNDGTFMGFSLKCTKNAVESHIHRGSSHLHDRWTHGISAGKFSIQIGMTPIKLMTYSVIHPNQLQ